MLDKTRNILIASAFRKANITSLESDPTAAEIEDAARTLNVMLQSWNNDGFRLFKIKTGFMPFIPNVNEYSLATQAYNHFETCKIVSFERTGATKIKLKDWASVSAGQKIVVLNNVPNNNTISDVDFENKVLTLGTEMQEPLYADDSVFYGNSFSMAKTEVKTFDSAFQTISFSEASVTPRVNDNIYVCCNGNWQKTTIYSVDTTNNTITLNTTFQGGSSVSSAFVFYGTSVWRTALVDNYPIEARVVYVNGLKGSPNSLAVVGTDSLGDILNIESITPVLGSLDLYRVLLKTAVDDNVLKDLGEVQIDATLQYPIFEQVSWTDLADQVPIDELDWGYVTDTSDLVVDDWGNVVDAATTLIDWGTLTGSAYISGFGKSANDSYVTVYDDENSITYLFYKPLGDTWQLIDTSAYDLTKSTLGMFNNSVYLIDPSAGVYELASGGIVDTYTTNGVEKIVAFGSRFYLISPLSLGGLRTVVSTDDFVVFSNSWSIDLLSVANPAEFLGKLYIGSTDTFVTGDMKTFNNINVYSESRSVIGDRLLNTNTNQYCSFTKDGVHFIPMPLMVSNQTAWGYKDGCTFVAVYGAVIDGVVGTQIYTTNDFNPVWTPQTKVAGKVFDIEFDDNNAYFVSDVEVQSLEYRKSVIAKDGLMAYAFGEAIGRPQELMNVVKYGMNNQMQLPMNAVSLKEYSLLPHEGLGGEPVNYCFFREAQDGKMMVWGTPSRFGEYLRFSYVEPITLLEGARSTPDFPDEYYEAVEDGLAAQLAIDYGLPLDRQQVLAARAQESKENAMLHDNEDTSYSIAPNERWH